MLWQFGFSHDFLVFIYEGLKLPDIPLFSLNFKNLSGTMAYHEG